MFQGFGAKPQMNHTSHSKSLPQSIVPQPQSTSNLPESQDIPQSQASQNLQQSQLSQSLPQSQLSQSLPQSQLSQSLPQSQSVQSTPQTQMMIDHKAAEAYKELEEEHEQLNDEFHRMMLQNKKLQDEVNSLHKQLKEVNESKPEDKSEELGQQIQSLQEQLTKEQERNNELEERLTNLVPANTSKTESTDEDESGTCAEWNDSEDDLFGSPAKKSENNSAPDDKQMVALLRSQMVTLRTENEQMKESLRSIQGPSPFVIPGSRVSDSESLKRMSETDEEIEQLRRQISDLQEAKQILEDKLNNSTGLSDVEIHNFKEIQEENDSLHSEIEKLNEELESIRRISSSDTTGLSDDTQLTTVSELTSVTMLADDKEKQDTTTNVGTAISGEIEKIREENESLRRDLETLRETYDKLVQAGDNLQDMYDQVLLEKDQVQEELDKNIQEKEEMVKENEFYYLTVMQCMMI
ncbi:hypothetical protein KUTeg_018175 [Tegillarca granosa]|uniref:Uncharacterized protein n=1 Tax=Tegillarca granosa TaxID=220873 RepID=A0ABQ9EKZ3_TEGGR|nr:hypothetical protein KUTeg_018175 [Tegillarca granosa]